MHDSCRIEPSEHEREHAAAGLPVITALRGAPLLAEVAVARCAELKRGYPASHGMRAFPVEKVHMIVVADPYVAGRDIAMDDAAGVRRTQSANELGRVAQQPPSRVRSHARPRAAVDEPVHELGERLTWHVGNGQVAGIVVFEVLANSGDSGKSAQPCQHRALVPEPSAVITPESIFGAVWPCLLQHARRRTSHATKIDRA